MSTEEKPTLVLIPYPILSHLAAAVKTAELLADRLSITVLIMKLPIDTKINSYIKNSPHSRLNFVELQEDESIFPDLQKNPKTLVSRFVDSQKGPVRDAVIELKKTCKIAGFVVDMFCTPMIDVANELGAPTYVFFTCGSGSLGLMLHLQMLDDDPDQDFSGFQDSDALVSIPTYVNPVPAKVWPYHIFDREFRFFDFIRRFRETKGIIINTFLEFEHHAITSLSVDEKIPPVYPVGPIIQEQSEETEERQRGDGIIAWLDEQPDDSVVFLCFGTRGCFYEPQVHEIAAALERSGVRFLWSLRKPPPKGEMAFPGEFEDPGEVLPEGFLERTSGVGKVIGWAPQMAVLAHPAVGGFVSHCGWNSILESVWFGVPVAVWPLSAEQQANAFQLVKDFEMAVEIQMDYRRDSDVIVPGEKIEKAIQELMDPGNGIRVKVKGLQEKSRGVMAKGGSSYDFLSRLIDDVIDKVD